MSPIRIATLTAVMAFGMVTTAVAGAFSRAKLVTLAANGSPAATIVVQQDAPFRMLKAAQDLQHYVHKICGVTLPLKTDGAAVSGFGLYIGKCAPTTPELFPGTSLNPESYAIAYRPDGLFFTGNHPSPCAFAVYSFLEDELGVRWFAPGELWELVPAGKQGSLTVEVKPRTVVPGTSPRIWSGHNWFPEWDDWNLRNMTVQSEVIPKRNFQNKIHTIFPPSKYAKTHPEYYPLCNGKRYIPQPGNIDWRPCEGNPEVQKIIIDYINDYFDKHPEVDSFSVGMDDIYHLCSCPLCRAMDPHPDSYEKKQFSDRHYKFVNIIAKGVAAKHPDKFIGTLIYSIALNPPETVTALEPNVFGYMTETSAYWWHKGQMVFDHELTRKWHRLCQHISRYDYYGFASLAPRYYPTFVDEQMKFDKKLGLEGMYIEVYTFLPLTMPMIWLTAKLQWDASRNSTKLIDNFMDIYGTAKPVMANFWALLENTYRKPRPGRGKWEHRNILNMALAISPDELHQALQLLDQADNATSDPLVHQRIDIHRGALELTRFAVEPLNIATQATNIHINSTANALKAIELARKNDQLASKREQFLDSLRKRDDLLGKNFIGLTEKMDYMPIGNFSTLETRAYSVMFNAIAWLAKNNQDTLLKISNDMKGTSGQLSAILTAINKKLNTGEIFTNLLVNGSFNDKKTDDNKAPLDWQNNGTPNGWYSWTNTPGMKITPTADKAGGFATTITMSTGNGVIIQQVPVKPGDKLMLSVSTKATGSGTVNISCRFHTPTGKWHPKRNLEPSMSVPAKDIPEWKSFTLLINIPEGAAKAVIMLGASRQDVNSIAFFDNAELIKLN